MTSEIKPDWNKLPEVFGLLLAKADMALLAVEDNEPELARRLLQEGVTHACETLGIPRVSKP